MAATDVVPCPLCDCPNRRGAFRCDACDELLDARIDPIALHAELRLRRLQIALSVGAIVAMVALNGLLFGGAGYVIALAPCGWLGYGVMRYRAVARAIALHGARQGASGPS